MPLDCLASEPGGAPVLVYDNHKAHRLGRRLPIPAATAALIRARQQRVRDRFPGTPASELKLPPTSWANRDGRRPLSVSALSTAHREWLASLPPLLLDGGGEFDKDRAVPYSYRHTYAQRHADAGVPIDVLAELLDHRDLNVTRGYYRVGEERRRGAVDRAAASGTEISASGIARAASVDRTFLYRHRDLLEKIHAAEATPPPGGETAGPAVTRASLQADLLAARERAIRLSTRVRQLEQRLSDALGEQAWRESGLGAPADIDALHEKITHLEQQAADLRLQLEERDDELAAAPPPTAS